jgi:XTP/dITP diphosphohydrolase
MLKKNRRFTETKLLIASGNKGKIMEITELFGGYNVQMIPASDFSIEEPEETGDSFKANAELKAMHYSKKSGLAALADDSGLCIEALYGEPGIHSARWAGEKKDYSLAIAKIQEELKKSTSQSLEAQFICALSLYWPDGHSETVEGKVKGTLTFPPRGEKGFGYDPIFIPRGYDKTFAELSGAVKHEISHRADAFRKLKAACFS